MNIFERTLSLPKITAEKSAFLFGARGTGKSFLIRRTLAEQSLVINLLKTQTYRRLRTDPSQLEAIIADYLSVKSNLEGHAPLIVIDEVQRVPQLLNEVHWLIEEKGLRFLLTGSSARKLKGNNANLLAGRARNYRIHPLTYREIPNFELDKFLLWGGLPEHFSSTDKVNYLDSYVDNYLKEEILAEQAIRNIDHFSNFLHMAAKCSGELINYSKIANDGQLSPSTVRNYFDILSDTLVGVQVPPWTKGTKRKTVSTAKFYLFDIGVRNRLLDLSSLNPNTTAYGTSFEHFIFAELYAYLSYKKVRKRLQFWRSKNGQEVDFVVGNLAIEVKSKARTSSKDSRHLRALREDGSHCTFIVISRDPVDRLDDGIAYLHWETFLKRLYQDTYEL